jgi:alcohol dehydrogenase class IV
MPNDDFHAWSYFNPVNIKFNVSANTELRGYRYAVVTYDEPYFANICKELEDLVGPAECIINDVQPNPDCQILHDQSERLNSKVTNIELIVALGGGSVIDTAKVLSASTLGFSKVLDFVTNEKKELNLPSIPIIAVPTTAGTGSEVTCWATIWDETEQKKIFTSSP